MNNIQTTPGIRLSSASLLFWPSSMILVRGEGLVDGLMRTGKWEKKWLELLSAPLRGLENRFLSLRTPESVPSSSRLVAWRGNP